MIRTINKIELLGIIFAIFAYLAFSLLDTIPKNFNYLLLCIPDTLYKIFIHFFSIFY